MDIAFNKLKYNILTKNVDLVNDDIKIALVSSSYTPSEDHNEWADVSYDEVVGTNYTAGGSSLTTKTVTQDDILNIVIFDADDVAWTASTITARYAVLYDDTLAGKDLLCVFDFTADKSSSNSTFSILWDTEGIFTIS